MKRIRSCPFGYRMENGTYTVVPAERRLIEQIFTRYLNGASLQQLSIMAEETGLKFRENASSWNKNMVSRILDNSRYWDGEQYPPIVEREIATKVTNEINQAMNQREVDPNELLPLILECAAEKYKTCSIKEADHLTITLKALFQAHSNDTTLDRELFERAVKQVILQPDASVQLRLLNDIVV